MKTFTMICALACTTLLAAVPATADGFFGGLNTGYTSGLGVHVAGTFHEFTRDLPLSARFTVGYNGAPAGDPYLARKVFINNNTNGDPEKKAKAWQLRFDLMIPAFDLGDQQLYLFTGPRLARYTANFNYIGGNENFDVKTNPWGAGTGLESWFAVSDKTDFVLQVGYDWYSRAEISGHDTAYLPSGDHVNPREDYDYGDADEAVGQPRHEILGMMGLRFEF
jgi:hypothetical protein